MSKLTMPRKLPRDYPRGDRRARCDYCGVIWYRSSLKRDMSGLLACPDDQKGREAVELNEGNANASNLQRAKSMPNTDGAGGDTNTLPIIHRTTLADIYRITS